MATKTLKTVPKISVKIWRPTLVFDLLDQVMHGCQRNPLSIEYRCTSVIL